MTMIVEDTIAIGRRLRELQEQSRRSEFKLPDDIVIYRAVDLTPPLRFSQNAEIVLMLHETRPPKLAIVHFRSPDTAREKLLEFVRVFEWHYPSAQVIHGEITMSQADCASLVDWLRQNR
jgi:hypothetical protein